MKTTAKGRVLIEQREGIRLTAYRDSVGIWTIGVGHTSVAGLPHVTPGMTITKAQCDEILSRDLMQFEKAVSKLTGGAGLADHEFDALVSLAFNIGAGDFLGSTVARRLAKGDKAGAADAFLMWNKGTIKGQKVVLPGLTTRRQAERKQFLNGY